ncbi:holdfast anchor protein HfaD [Brevundimonas sp. VNH65]|uniref:holdfast anchor protein HfaD n=1 Tax=Brevundimonas sp. VNH65 TaxID=3400917 RepID=UPI003C116452
MLIAIATCAAAATEASSQDRSLVLNNQLQLGDVIAGQTLVVEGADEQVTVSNAATGNSVAGAVVGGGIEFRNVQHLNANVRAVTTPAPGGGEIGGVVNATTQANGNYASAAGYGADVAVDSDQRVGPYEIEAATSITGGTSRLLSGAYVNAAATANTMALGGENTHVSGAVHQLNEASVRASNLAETQYIPAEAVFQSQAVGNSTTSNGTGASSAYLYVGQRSTGDVIIADTSANAGNAWDLSGAAAATANQAVLSSAGGSVVARTQQENASQVVSQAVVTSYDYGVARSAARGAANAVSIGNQDLHLEIDNSQINTGGVEVRASFAGTNGYDAYVSAEAVGNTVTGYACAECQATMTVNNSQINEGAVSATANAVINAPGRAVIVGTNAVGNAANFYVSRPNGGN